MAFIDNAVVALVLQIVVLYSNFILSDDRSLAMVSMKASRYVNMDALIVKFVCVRVRVCECVCGCVLFNKYVR